MCHCKVLSVSFSRTGIVRDHDKERKTGKWENGNTVKTAIQSFIYRGDGVEKWT